MLIVDSMAAKIPILIHVMNGNAERLEYLLIQLTLFQAKK